MYKLGDVVLIKMHPASGHELKKFRPALVIQNNTVRNFITFIPFTSQIEKLSSAEVLVHYSKENGLDKNSLLLCWYVQTVNSKRVQKKIGQLSKKELINIKKIISKYLHIL